MTAEEHEDGAILQAVLDAALDAIVVSDAQGNILRTNAAAAALFQHRQDDLTGRNVALLMPATMADHHDGYIARHLDTGEQHIIGIGREVEGQRKDGSTFPLHLSVGAAKIGDRQLFVGIMHDLTKSKATEAALSRSQRLDAIGQMTGGIAHDFNNLLTVIIGNLELLERRQPTDRQAPLISDALASAEAGAELTGRLMKFAGRSDLKPRKTDLAALCSETLAILERALGENYRIRTDFPEGIHPVMVDPMELQSALMNLALNARDAMGDSGEIVVSLANVTIDDTYMAQETNTAPGHYVRLSVSDNGAGMSAEAQARAFEPFFTTKAESGGTGLGLAMVYGFVRQSGGHITLYSEEGLGTNFGLYFPVISALGVSDGPAVSVTSSQPQMEAPGGTVLVVEDNPKVRAVTVARLQDLGFATLEATSGDEAYNILQSGAAVDLVLSDLVMPGGLNGYDLAALVANEFPAIPVLLTSGYASDIVTAKLSSGSVPKILHKPYHQADLAARIQALLADRSAG